MLPEGCTVTVVPGGGRDQRTGDPLPAGSTSPLEGVIAISPRAYTGASSQSLDQDRARSGQVVAVTLYAAFDPQLTHLDRVEIAGHSHGMDGLYEVDGDPSNWASPFTDWKPGAEVSLRRAEG